MQGRGGGPGGLDPLVLEKVFLMQIAQFNSGIGLTTAGPAGHMPYQLESCALPTCLSLHRWWGDAECSLY